jgi:hypothetical protein
MAAPQLRGKEFSGGSSPSGRGSADEARAIRDRDFCTADREIADAKTRSKWSRVLRYALKAKPIGQSLTEFIKSNGGINECARKFARNK